MNEYIEKIVRAYFETNNRLIDDKSSQILFDKVVKSLLQRVQNEEYMIETIETSDREKKRKKNSVSCTAKISNSVHTTAKHIRSNQKKLHKDSCKKKSLKK